MPPENGGTGTATFTQRLSDIVGARHLVTDADAWQRYTVDERRLYSGVPLAVAKPANTDEIAAIMRLCNDARVAVVPQGGNTGYCGGATPDSSGRQLVLSLERLNRIIEVDALSGNLTLEAGVVLGDARVAAAEAGMLLPMNMGSRDACQIGGNLSTNAGGLAVLRYGTMRDLTLGLEIVLPDGRRIDALNGLRKDTTGYDLKQLFIGAEGTLGIITAACLKLFPQPSAQVTLLASVRDVEAACALLADLRQACGDCVTSFEYMAREALDYVLTTDETARPPLDPDCNHLVLAECAAFDASMLEVIETAIAALFDDRITAGTVTDAAIARGESQRLAFWRLRERVPAAEKMLGGSVKHDVSVTTRMVPEFIRRARECIRRDWPGARLSVYGHIGDGNIHFNVLAPSAEDAPAFRDRHGLAISEAVHELAADLRGSFSAEHGVGQLKRDVLERLADPVEHALMREVKALLDPRGIMNPGKIVQAESNPAPSM